MNQEIELILVSDDGDRIELTREHILRSTERWLADPEMVSARMWESEDLQACAICPLFEKMAFCHALHPLLPIAERSGDFDLGTDVTVMLRDGAGDHPIRTRRTTIAGAMQCVALLSLTQYCATGMKYAPYYRGASVIMDVEEFADHVVRNLLAEAKGDEEEMLRRAGQFSHDLQTTSHGQIGRLRLLSTRRPMINAVINALILLECLVEEKSRTLLSSTPACRIEVTSGAVK